jgi:hypothetical protein
LNCGRLVDIKACENKVISRAIKQYHSRRDYTSIYPYVTSDGIQKRLQSQMGTNFPFGVC